MMRQIEPSSSAFNGAAIVTLLLPLAAALTNAPFLLLRAWVLTVLWAWYVVPLLGMPRLGVATAFGLLLVAAQVAGPSVSMLKGDLLDGVAGRAVSMIVRPLTALLLGWCGMWFL